MTAAWKTAATLELIRVRRAEGVKFRAIAAELGVKPNQVIGASHRADHPHPSRTGGTFVPWTDAELAVLRRVPMAFCPSAALPEAGSYIARTTVGTPLLVVRGSDGIVRGFRNACRHRGMKLADGEGCARAFACPYHAWTYGLDGSLRHVPGEAGFPGLDKETHGLVPVTVHEKGGIVFVTHFLDQVYAVSDRITVRRNGQLVG